MKHRNISSTTRSSTKPTTDNLRVTLTSNKNQKTKFFELETRSIKTGVRIKEKNPQGDPKKIFIFQPESGNKIIGKSKS